MQISKQIIIHAFYQLSYTTVTLLKFTYAYIQITAQDSIAGIVIHHELDSLGIESRWGRDFPHLSRPAVRPTQPAIQWVPGLSQG